MPKTLRKTRAPREGARFLAEVVAANVAARRHVFQPTMTHAALAERMRVLGHDWKPHTISDLERGRRTIHVEELGALAIALHATIPMLLDPTLTLADATSIDVGGDLDEHVIPAERGRRWLYGRRTFALQRSGDGWEIQYGDARPPEIPSYYDESQRDVRVDLERARDRNRSER
jgi:hypothetical protein